MTDKKQLVSVTNITNHGVGFSIPALNGVGTIRRKFNAHETTLIPYEELEKAIWTKGSRVILQQYLRIDDKNIASELFGFKVEPEYSYSKEDVKRILLTGSLDEVKDMIDFGPEAIGDVVKEVAIEEKLDSLDKRQAIKEMLGFDVGHYLTLNEGVEEEKTAEKVRRTNNKENNSPSEEEIIANATKQRRVAEPPKYNVVS